MNMSALKHTADRYSLTLAVIAWLIVISGLVYLVADIPFALRVLQIPAVFLVGEFLAARIMKRKKPLAGKKTTVWVAFTMAVLAYINYVWFFYRMNIEASGLGMSSLVHAKASTLAFLTVILCTLAFLLLQSVKRPVSTQSIRFKKHSLKAVGISLTAIWTVIYLPIIQSVFSLSPLSFADWLYALLAVIIFVAIIEIQKHMSLHSRKAVHALHPKLK